MRPKLKFTKIVHKYYSTSRIIPPSDEDNRYNCQAYCHLLGKWFDDDHVKATHIVPSRFKGSSLDYIFGHPEENLEVGRNALSLHSDVKTAFDKKQITFVPVSGSAPSEWKMVILNPILLNHAITWHPQTEPILRWKVSYIFLLLFHFLLLIYTSISLHPPSIQPNY